MKKIIFIALLCSIAQNSHTIEGLGKYRENLISDAVIYVPVSIIQAVYTFVTTKENWFYTEKNMPNFTWEDAVSLNVPTIPCLDNLTKQNN